MFRDDPIILHRLIQDKLYAFFLVRFIFIIRIKDKDLPIFCTGKRHVMPFIQKQGDIDCAFSLPVLQWLKNVKRGIFPI